MGDVSEPSVCETVTQVAVEEHGRDPRAGRFSERLSATPELGESASAHQHLMLSLSFLILHIETILDVI